MSIKCFWKMKLKMFRQLVQEIKEKLFNLDITQVELFLYTVRML